jgi:hypothetical protein
VRAAATPQAGSFPLTWDRYLHLTGVFDVGGPLADGRLVVAGSKQLFAVDPRTGEVGTFGPEGGQGGEAYMAVSPGPALAVPKSGCAFTPGEVYQLGLGAPPAVVRIDALGHAHPFATLTDAGSPNGITFDTTGRFGHRLLVSGSRGGKTTLVALDCAGRSQLVTDSAPPMEGGLVVAPAGFGSFAGDLLGPDELSGDLIAVRPDGSLAVIARSGLPTGGDIGVESLGFVPAGFAAGGHAYLADRATSNNPHPGTDSLLRLDASRILGAGVREGDLLAGTEGGALTIAVRCGRDCRVFRVARGPTVAHGEGHLMVVADHPANVQSPLPAAQDLGSTVRTGQLTRQLVALAVILVIAALGTALLGWWLRRRRHA